MKLISRYILKEHLPPFIMALFVLLFVLLANFLLRSIDKFLGKGLEFSLLIEYIFLNLAWILALAVPMAVLVATMMAYGRLSADNEIGAMRASGVGYGKLIFPAIVFGIVITMLMTVFNNWYLPEMNHKARLLSADFSRKRPDLEFDSGYFIDALPNHTILLGGRNNDTFLDIIIFNTDKTSSKNTITAETGTIETIDDGVILHLQKGVIHELAGQNDEYRQIYFDNYDVVIPVDNLVMQRRDSKIRGDREMTYEMIRKKIASFEDKIENVRERIDNRLNSEAELNILHRKSEDIINTQLDHYEFTMIDSLKNEDVTVLGNFKRRLRNLKRGIKSDFTLINSYEKSISKYLVELHKKFSIPFASIIFILIGAPLGIMSRKGGFALSMAFSLGFFIIYWAFLIGGEEFADRGLLSPVTSMWLPNVILGIIGLYLYYTISREQQFFQFELLHIFKSKNEVEND
jgi:lipopolysaccharide export system permease protein